MRPSAAWPRTQTNGESSEPRSQIRSRHPLKTYEVEYTVREFRKIILRAGSEAEAIAQGKRAQAAGAVFEITHDDDDDWRADEVQP
jgi:hypothetical protein